MPARPCTPGLAQLASSKSVSCAFLAFAAAEQAATVCGDAAAEQAAPLLGRVCPPMRRNNYMEGDAANVPK